MKAFNNLSTNGPSSSEFALHPVLYSLCSKRLILKSKLSIDWFGLGIARSHPSGMDDPGAEALGFSSAPLAPNASGEPRPEAGAERTLEGVGSTALFGSVETFRNIPVATAHKATLTAWDVLLHSYSAGVRREAIQRANDCALSPLRRPASRPSTPICSSSSGHSIAYPSPSNCQCCRSAGDPCTRRGYHASGTTRLRPSARSTVNLSSVTVTCTATGSVSSTKVVMPRLKKSCLVLHHKSRDPADLVCAKATIGHERHRLQPKLGHGPLTLYVNVRRFPAVRAEENETVRSITKYSRHRAALLMHMFLYSEERLYAEKRKVATEAQHSAGVPCGPRVEASSPALPPPGSLPSHNAPPHATPLPTST